MNNKVSTMLEKIMGDKHGKTWHKLTHKQKGMVRKSFKNNEKLAYVSLQTILKELKIK